jgi:hypothetical protein
LEFICIRNLKGGIKMERRVVESIIVDIVGEYGIAKVKEETVWNNGKVFGKKVMYDVCLDKGEGDIVASFNKIIEARKLAKEN